jgi:hypothetical protein
MVSTAADFKKRNRKTVTLPSGLSVEIRRLTARDFVGVGEIPLPATQDVSEKSVVDRARQLAADPDAMDRYGHRAITRGVARPRFSDRDEDLGREDIAHVRDLDLLDYGALLVEILKFAGIYQEAGQTAESFRADGEPGHGGPAGAAVR